MAKQTTVKAGGFPEIPDHPNSPLPAWKHYGIVKVLEEKFHAELERAGYAGHLVGLDVTYFVGGDPYTMDYGYAVKDIPGIWEKQEDPLTDEFVSEIYDFANGLVAEHMNPYVSGYDLLLSASVNQNLITKQIKCQIATRANCGKRGCIGKCRKFIKKNNGPWVCQHTSGTCRCS